MGSVVPLPLLTPRLVIRPFEDRDAFSLSAYRSDPDVARYQSWEPPFTLAQAQLFIEELHATAFLAPGEWFQLAIESRDTQQILGDLALCPFESDPQTVELGFTLAREHQHQGFATEAVQRLLEFLFVEKGVRRVIAHCDTRNTASVRLLERVGMRREGCFVENIWFKNAWSSEYAYALLHQEWSLQPQ